MGVAASFVHPLCSCGQTLPFISHCIGTPNGHYSRICRAELNAAPADITNQKKLAQ
ncbi:hypothetical protein I79_006789 [Cricetulus griseus]|uniref:Uncharacterized protein n=1 Tax=Cricetulus griseus TaxID=10029 RepID=G3H8S8_CRIGR|nr:hypothetical protein I79_006789 [Cricetulus griseus]